MILFHQAIFKKNRWLIAIGMIITTFVIMALVLPSMINALSGSQFQAGRITDDSVFYNPNSMTSDQIQRFLDAKVPTCDTWGQQMYNSSMTRAQYGASQGNPPPYTCLKGYSQSIPGISNSGSNLCSGNIAGGTKHASTIIKEVAVACGINPQVLLVLLQKEQSLVTDDWPWPVQYQKATGYGCPDTAPCDAQYYGFFNQVYNAAMGYKRYRANPANYNYRAGRNNTILWHPNTACGTSTVYIENQATAGLYIYTPYRPNQAALNNLYGTGDSCSSYGNRNFWRMFSDWFGSTLAPNYAWGVASQEIYVDSNRTIPANWGALNPSTSYYIRVKARNMGNRTWSRTTNPVLLGTKSDVRSTICDSSWINCTRAALLKEVSVAPGEVGTFEFSIRTPSTLGTVRQDFNLVSEGNAWMDDIGMHLAFGIKGPTYAWSFAGQGLFYDTARTNSANGNALSPNTTYHATLRARNNGNTTWRNTGPNPMKLGTNNPIDRRSGMCNNTWASCNRPAILKEASVNPGGIGTFEFSFTTPTKNGDYREYFRPVVEGVEWLNDIGQNWLLNVKPPTYAWQFAGQSSYLDSAKTQVANLNKVVNGSRIYYVLKTKNVGNTAWSNAGSNPVRLGVSNPIDSRSPICDSSWTSDCNRAASLKETSVAPGQLGTFEFWGLSPYKINGTNIQAHFRPLSEGRQWMNDLGQHWKITMQTPDYIWQYGGQGLFLDAARTTPITTYNLQADTPYYARVRAKNIGGKIWYSSNTRLGTSNPPDRSSLFYDNSWVNTNRPARLVEPSVGPGQSGTFDFIIKTPAAPGSYPEYFRPLVEGIVWMNDIGMHWNFVVN